MSLSTNIVNLATRVATEVKSVRTLINGNAADLSSLTTTAKGNLVASLNELKSDLTALSTELSAYETATDADIQAIQGTVAGIQAALDSIDVSAQVQAIIVDELAPGTTTVWSSYKTQAEINAAIGSVVDMAPGALDTLNELAAALNDDASFASTITDLINGKADFIHAHQMSEVLGLQAALTGKASAASVASLTTEIGDTSTNYSSTFEAGLA